MCSNHFQGIMCDSPIYVKTSIINFCQFGSMMNSIIGWDFNQICVLLLYCGTMFQY